MTRWGEAEKPNIPESTPHYSVRDQQNDRHVVIPDIHGEHAVLDTIINHYIDEEDIDFVFLGDVLDRKGVESDPEKGVFKTLEIIRRLGDRAVLTMGNHEWLFLAASFARDPGYRQALQREWMGTNQQNGIEKNVLVSYGLDPERREPSTNARLRRKMAHAGHLGLLTNAAPYFETARFIATHAGVIPETPWEAQRDYLEEVAMEMGEGYFYDKPPQWFSMKLATTTTNKYDTDKIVLSGHAHVIGHPSRKYPDQSPARVLHGGQRVRLASTLNAPTNAHAFVWQDWDEGVIVFPQAVPTEVSTPVDIE